MNRLAINGGNPVRMNPFTEWPIYGEMEERLLLEVLRSGKWGGIGREKLPEFERQFAVSHEAEYAISTVNGTVAITIALMAAGVQSGDEVIMPPYTFIATASAALMFGAIPVFVDVEADTMLLDPELVEAAVTPKTKAIIAVHIGGAPANMDKLKQIADKHGLRLIEDAAQAAGSRWNGKGVGAIGDLGTFSFQSSKNVTAGEGGIILTNNGQYADAAWSLANVGRVRDGGWYQHERVGWNLRMTEFQAAVLLGQMSRFEEQTATRERNGLLLTNLLRQIEGVRVMRYDPKISRHSYHLYMFAIATERSSFVNKQDFIRKLVSEGIPAAAGYVPLNKNAAIIEGTRRWTQEARVYSCPVAESAADTEIIWLHQNVLLGDESDMLDIAQAVSKVMSSYEGA